MQQNVEEFSPVRLPAAVGDAVLAAEPLRHGLANAATGGIWRVRGTAGSAVLKVARLPARPDAPRAFPTSDEPSHWNYWQREALAYRTGLAAAAYAGAGITAPVMLAADTRADGGIELWLADVSGTGGFDWPVPRLARFGHELGAAQARWAGGVPDIPWLSRRWLAQYVAARARNWTGTVQAIDWDHASLAPWPAPLRARLRRLWADKDRALAASQTAERTLCHLDVWPANLVDDGTSVLLDWSFTGEGAVGEDIANLVVDCFADGLMDIALLPEVAETVTDGYLAGLRDGGWDGSDDVVRRAIAASGAAKYSWFGPAMAARAVRGDLGKSSYRQDTSAASAVRRLAPLVALIAEWAAVTEADYG